jgi:hypothetical protein
LESAREGSTDTPQEATARTNDADLRTPQALAMGVCQDADTDFERFEDIFPRVTEETVEHFKPIALKAMEKTA